MSSPGPFHGAYTALVTPFRDGRLDEAAFRALLERQLDGGVSGLVPCGTTGEAPTLAPDEWASLVRWTTEAAAGRVPVIVGVGSYDTAQAIHKARQARDLGADGVLATTPYYNKPTQAGLVAHFTAIADAVPDVSVVLYDVPGRTAVRLSRETILTLAAHPAINALKDATGDLAHASALIGALPDGFSMLSGDDGTTLPFVCVGGHGCISVLSNVAPAATARMVAAGRAGDLNLARPLHLALTPFIDALFVQTNPLPVKTALAELGLCAEEFRLQLVPMDPGPRRVLVEALARHAETTRG